jgi:hypothetical protein
MEMTAATEATTVPVTLASPISGAQPLNGQGHWLTRPDRKSEYGIMSSCGVRIGNELHLDDKRSGLLHRSVRIAKRVRCECFPSNVVRAAPSRRSVQLIRCDRGRCRKHRPRTTPRRRGASPLPSPTRPTRCSGDVCLRCCTPDTESRHLGGQLAGLGTQPQVEAQGEPIAGGNADHRDLDPFVGKWRGSTPALVLQVPSLPQVREAEVPSDHRRHRPCDSAQRRRRPRSCLTSPERFPQRRLGRPRQVRVA